MPIFSKFYYKVFLPTHSETLANVTRPYFHCELIRQVFQYIQTVYTCMIIICGFLHLLGPTDTDTLYSTNLICSKLVFSTDSVIIIHVLSIYIFPLFRCQMFFSSLQMSNVRKLPFATPFIRPIITSSLEVLAAWVDLRKPYARELAQADKRIYQLVRAQVNDRRSYARRTRDPDTGPALMAKNAERSQVILPLHFI